MKINKVNCYEKLSVKDVEGMKGDCGPRITTTYDRYDPDCERCVERKAGSLPLKRRDIKCGTLAQRYREFALYPVDFTLGAVRNIFGVIALNDLRKMIRENGNLLIFRSKK